MNEELKNIDQQIINLRKQKQELLNKDKEKFEPKKFWAGFGGLLDPIGWAKDIVGLFNVRKLLVYGLILLTVAIYFYVQGKGETPIRINLDYREEFVLDLNGEYLHKPKNSNDLYIKDSKTNEILKHLKAKDFPLLKKKLSPLGFIFEPVGIMGGGIGDEGTTFEGGIGVSLFRFYRVRIEPFLTNRGVYLGGSYKITDNSGLGLGIGKGWQGDNRGIIYYSWIF